MPEQVIAEVRADIADVEGLADTTTSPELAERLSEDIARLVSLFPHYKRKELLLLPRLELLAGSGARCLLDATLDRDNEVRSLVGMACSLLPGAKARPSAGNLQSVAAQLAEACDAAERAATDEERTLAPLAAERLGGRDWEQLLDSKDDNAWEALVDDPATWGPSALDIAEARLRARG